MNKTYWDCQFPFENDIAYMLFILNIRWDAKDTLKGQAHTGCDPEIIIHMHTVCSQPPLPAGRLR